MLKLFERQGGLDLTSPASHEPNKASTISYAVSSSGDVARLARLG
jgi:hypothetical protein